MAPEQEEWAIAHMPLLEGVEHAMTIDPDRVQKILNTALAMPIDQRAAFVADACAADAGLQAEVESLLEHAPEPRSSHNAPTTPDRPAASLPAEDANIGRTIDRYTITARAGRGRLRPRLPGIAVRADST